jgi:capsular polysaccharide transport system ATP-binding protein
MSDDAITHTLFKKLPVRCRFEITAVNVTKEFHTELGSHRVLDQISFSARPGDRLAILGRNGAGKSTLIRIIGGIIQPSSGRVIRTMSMSWPVGLGGQFEGMLTGYDNIRFIAKLYNSNIDYVFDFVENFTELGQHLNIQTRYFSDGMRMRLAFALSLAIDFECILIDEILMVGDAKFQRKCEIELFEKRAHKTMIMAIHNADFVKNFCNKALVLKRGLGRVFDDVHLATRIYSNL